MEQASFPCLATRIPFGTPLTREELKRVEDAEEVVAQYGFRELRVQKYRRYRTHRNPDRCASALIAPEVREPIVAALQELGYRFVTIDLNGLRSGSMNRKNRKGIKPSSCQPMPDAVSTNMPSDALDIQQCVRCGNCMELCPTFAEALSESMGPRGRVALLKEMATSGMSRTRPLDERIFSCMLCGACNGHCPAGISITEAVYAEEPVSGSSGRPRVERTVDPSCVPSCCTGVSFGAGGARHQ